MINTVATPLLLLSGITLPLTLAPKIIRSIASMNPLAYEVTASRALFLGNFSDSAIVLAFALLGAWPCWHSGGRSRSFKRAAA